MQIEAPTPTQVLAARLAAQMTQVDAAATIHAGRRTWQNWESGIRHMQPSDWELFLLKTGQHPTHTMVAREAAQ